MAWLSRRTPANLSSALQHADGGWRDPVGTALRVWAMEEIAQRPPTMRVQPATTAMLGSIVDHVAALAQGCQLVEGAVTGIVVEVRAGQHHFGPFASCEDVLGWASHAPPLRTPPVEPLRVPPPPVPQMKDALAMRSPTMLANAPCPFEADEVRDMLPVDRVQKDMFRADRHQIITHAAIDDSLSRP